MFINIQLSILCCFFQQLLSLLLTFIHSKILLNFFFYCSFLHLLVYFGFGFIPVVLILQMMNILRCYLVLFRNTNLAHFLLQLPSIRVTHPVLLLHLIQHLLLVLAALSFLLDPVFVSDLLTLLLPLIFFINVLLLSLEFCVFKSLFPLFFFLEIGTIIIK